MRRIVPEEQRKPVVLVGNKCDIVGTSNMEVKIFLKFLHLFTEAK